MTPNKFRDRSHANVCIMHTVQQERYRLDLFLHTDDRS
jgi:hypothetical protein